MAEIPEGGVLNITIAQGGDFSETFECKEADGETVIPLTGYTGKAQMRVAPRRGLLAEFDVAVDEEAGTVTISLAAEVTAALPSSGTYDVALIHSSGSVILPFVQGNATLDPRVTVVDDEGS